MILRKAASYALIFSVLILISSVAVSQLSELAKDSKQLERECSGGKASACTRVGTRMAFGTHGYARDYSKAMIFLTKGCEGGDPQGCHEIGVMHEHGRGVSKDYAKAASFYEKACTGRIANSCHNLGDMYRLGKGVKQNSALSTEYYLKACKLGSKWSCDKAKGK